MQEKIREAAVMEKKKIWNDEPVKENEPEMDVHSLTDAEIDLTTGYSSQDWIERA